MLLIFTVFALALIASLALTASVRHWARQWNFVDRPDGQRKIQREPVALGGGLAIFGACLVALAVIGVTRNLWDWKEIQATFLLQGYQAPPLNFYQIGLLMISAAVLCGVGCMMIVTICAGEPSCCGKSWLVR